MRALAMGTHEQRRRNLMKKLQKNGEAADRQGGQVDAAECKIGNHVEM